MASTALARLFPAQTSLLLFIVSSIAVLPSTVMSGEDASSSSASFKTDVAKILVERCLGCHGGDATEGGYSMMTAKSLFTPGDSELSPIVLNDASNSEIYKRLVTSDKDLMMPQGGPRLSDSEIAMIGAWINRGADVDMSHESKLVEALSAKSDAFDIPLHYPRSIPVSAVAFGEQAASVFTSGLHEVLHWDRQGKLLERIRMRAKRISDISISNDAQTLVILSGEPGILGFVELFRRQDDGWSSQWYHSYKDLPSDGAISPDGTRVIVGTSAGNLQVIESDSGNILYDISAHAASVTSVAWSENGERFFSGARDRMAKAFETGTGNLIASFAEHERVVGGLMPSNEGLITLDETGQLKNFNASLNAHVVSRQGGNSQRVSKLAGNANEFFALQQRAVARLQNFSESIDDGVDDQGNKKTKWQNRFKRLGEITIPLEGTPLCIHARTIDGKTHLVAGLSSGHVVIWTADQWDAPELSFVAQP